ncbi:MAG: hypothetical protein OQK67_05320 [Chlorobium sp.]|nr:hypothetical protein [Chlorobium sp.]
MSARLILMLILLFPFSLGNAAERPADQPRFISVFSPSRVTIGDRVSYRTTAVFDSSLTVSFTLPDSTELMPFVLVHREVKWPENGIAVLHAELAVFDVGEYELPPVTMVFQESTGKKNTHLSAPRGSLMVEALTDSAMTELLPIKPIKQPYTSWAEYLPAVYVLAAVAAVILLVRRLMKKNIEPSRKPLDFRKEALKQISRLEKHLEKGMPPEACYEQLSYLIREYLEGAYHIKALEAVTREIGDELEGSGVPHADMLVGLLDQADLVKFAESRPMTEECRLSIDQAKKAISSS